MLQKELRRWLLQQLPQKQPIFSADRQAATAVIITADSLDLLLMERAQDPRDPWSGQMALPGGRRDPSDMDLVFTAQRESKEEVGISLSRKQFAGFLPPLEALPQRAKETLMIQPVVFIVPERQQLTLNAEAASALWVPYSLLTRTEQRQNFALKREGISYNLPCWNISGKTIWGLTERMLTSFIELSQLDKALLLKNLTGGHALP